MDNATPDEEVTEEEEGQQNPPTRDRPADAQDREFPGLATQEDQSPPPASDAAQSPSPSTSGNAQDIQGRKHTIGCFPRDRF